MGVQEAATSYANIGLSIGATNPAEIVFATDTMAEAKAAGDVGWCPVLVKRPGNKPLSVPCGMKMITSMEAILRI